MRWEKGRGIEDFVLDQGLDLFEHGCFGRDKEIDK